MSAARSYELHLEKLASSLAENPMAYEKAQFAAKEVLTNFIECWHLVRVTMLVAQGISYPGLEVTRWVSGAIVSSMSEVSSP